MTDMRTRLRRLTHKIKTTYLQPQGLILAAALLLCVVWVVSAISTMSKNWEQQRALESVRLEFARLALEIEMAELNQQYYRTEEYLELVARSRLNKVTAGETLVTLPQNSDRAISADHEARPTTDPTSPPVSNFSEWLRFLFH